MLVRTTITFASDVAAVIEQRRAAEGAGVSEIVNDLIRRGAVAERRSAPPPPLPTFDMGMMIDVRDTGEVLAVLDEQHH